MPRVPAAVRRLAAMTAIALAITGMAARAMALDSQGPADSSFTVQMAPTTDSATTTTEPFPPISIQPLPAGTPVAPASAATTTQSMQQTLVLVINGGRMSVSPTSVDVVLHRKSDGNFAGKFGPITVVDARGSLVGWKLTAALPAPESGRPTVHPDAAVAVTGRPGEAAASHAATLTADGTVIMSAAPDGGGGDFSISGTIEKDGGNHDGGTATVSLAFTVS